MRIVFLAAGKSNRIYKKIKKNKCLLTVNNKPIIKTLINEAKNANIKKFTIVLGFNAKFLRKKLKNLKNIDFLLNKKFETTEMLYSMILAIKKYNSDLIISYSDILFDKQILIKLLKSKKNNIMIPILRNWKKVWKIRNKDPLEDGETLLLDNKKNLKSIGEKIKQLKDIKYQYMGIIFIPKFQRKKVLSAYQKINKNKKMHASNFLSYLLKKNFIINTIVENSKWYEFDDYEDYLNYKKIN
tara:strand:- start:494 stop:1219 length:726 start_codon:yes stop_codon:yes gene_type:complete